MANSLTSKLVTAIAGLAVGSALGCGPNARHAPVAPITQVKTVDPTPLIPQEPIVLPGQSALPRVFYDRPDDFSGPQVHIVYALAGDGLDGHLDENGTLNRSVESFQKWFADRTNKEVRIDTYSGVPDVSFLRLRRSGQDVLDAENVPYLLEQELASAGLDSENKKFIVYYDGKTASDCGSAMRGRKAAGVYLQGEGNSLCRRDWLGTGRYPDMVALHELGHVLGFVDAKAPHYSTSRGGGHVPEPTDLMYCGCNGNWDPQEVDVGRDDYFGHGREDLADMARSPFLRDAKKGKE